MRSNEDVCDTVPRDVPGHMCSVTRNMLRELALGKTMKWRSACPVTTLLFPAPHFAYPSICRQHLSWLRLPVHPCDGRICVLAEVPWSDIDICMTAEQRARVK